MQQAVLERPGIFSELVKAQIVSPFYQIYWVQLRNVLVNHHHLHTCHHHIPPHHCSHSYSSSSDPLVKFSRCCSSFLLRINYSPSWTIVQCNILNTLRWPVVVFIAYSIHLQIFLWLLKPVYTQVTLKAAIIAAMMVLLKDMQLCFKATTSPSAKQTGQVSIWAVSSCPASKACTGSSTMSSAFSFSNSSDHS